MEGKPHRIDQSINVFVLNQAEKNSYQSNFWALLWVVLFPFVCIPGVVLHPVPELVLNSR